LRGIPSGQIKEWKRGQIYGVPQRIGPQSFDGMFFLLLLQKSPGILDKIF
jgi:hypothetical protein